MFLLLPNGFSDKARHEAMAETHATRLSHCLKRNETGGNATSFCQAKLSSAAVASICQACKVAGPASTHDANPAAPGSPPMPRQSAVAGAAT